MFHRRDFLNSLSGLPLLGGLFSGSAAMAATAKRDLLKELGVRPFINAAGTYTMLTSSVMPPEVTQAWQSAAQRYVRLEELQDAVGRRLSSLIGCEAAKTIASNSGAFASRSAAAAMVSSTSPNGINAPIYKESLTLHSGKWRVNPAIFMVYASFTVQSSLSSSILSQYSISVAQAQEEIGKVASVLFRQILRRGGIPGDQRSACRPVCAVSHQVYPDLRFRAGGAHNEGRAVGQLKI
jgi:hypothetical protein